MSLNTIYFDSSILIVAGWPRPSTELTNLLHVARMEGVEVIMPLAVELELEERWIREREKAGREITAKVEDFNRRTKSILTPICLELPSVVELRSQYRVHIQILKEVLWIGSIPLSIRPLQSVFEMANKLTPPFVEKGVGFKDMVILLSVLEHLEASSDRQGALIAQDRIFEKVPIAELCPAVNSRINIYKEIKDVYAILLESLKKVYLDAFHVDLREIKTILDQKRAELKLFIETNLVFDTSQLPGSVFLVKSLEVSNVKEETIQPPIPRPKDSQDVAISFDVEVIFHAVVTKFPSLEPRPWKVGEVTPVVGLINSEILAPRQEEENLARTVRVEASASFNKGYRDIRFISVSLKPVGFGLGLLGLGST